MMLNGSHKIVPPVVVNADWKQKYERESVMRSVPISSN